ncbi:DUF4920 domain-containing protein [Kangiella sp. HZ709]|uniref:DUF4920 domain-containing protein n=1 Tax=Kangiella sp. HZ709 TaxID=2666328 RepID=UPI0012AF4F45|nr:DUF4920 domain-containing protein [Kangiella sp. HZ709]MRX28458.1 DUF4920 domain-containing protein [Kangiella sp. HZ709]
MKKIIIITVGLLFTIYGTHAKELLLGDPVNMDLYQPLEEISKQLASYTNQQITLKGQITKVCKKKGCWADIKSGDEQIRIKVTDDVIVIPIYTVGREAYATGTLKSKVMSKEETINYLQHMADDAGETFAPANVKQGMTLYQLQAEAIRIF